MLTGFLSHLVRDLGFASSTIDTRFAALSFWYRRQLVHFHLAQVPAFDNPLESVAIRQGLRVARRRFGGTPKGRRPLDKIEFRRMYTYGFDLASPAGLHNRLALLLLNFGCLRRKAAAHLRVSFYIAESGQVVYRPESNVRVLWDSERQEYYIELQIDVDKNVLEGDRVFAYIPQAIPGFGLSPVHLLDDYLRRVRPPSGGFLLAAPRSRQFPPTSFQSGPYSNFAKAFKTAYLRAWPSASATDTARIGSHSGRKSLAQWLWDAYQSTRLIADIGHWKTSGDAFNLYFVSSRAVILDCIARL